jgi:5-phospho-D-xylono-1,4-lactonase
MSIYIQTVKGLIKKESLKIVDAHIHCTITEFNSYRFIKKELKMFKDSGGNGLIDCTPFGCGRNGNALKRLNYDTGINIIAVTGFHRKSFYPSDFRLWEKNISELEEFFISEVLDCLSECKNADAKIKAGVIKIPFIGELEGQYLKLTQAAINASIKTGAPILVHTEYGINIEYFVDFLERSGINPNKVMLNHMDKKNDLALHINLAKRGYYLEYDTFWREKYDPEKKLWPFIERMVDKGYGGAIIAASDIYGDVMWKMTSKRGGLSAFFSSIIVKLQRLKIPEDIINKIIGGNVSDFLSFKTGP